MAVQLNETEQEFLAKAMWMAAFEQTLKACQENKIPSNIIATSMIEVMTTVVKALLGVED